MLPSRRTEKPKNSNMCSASLLAMTCSGNVRMSRMKAGIGNMSNSNARGYNKSRSPEKPSIYNREPSKENQNAARVREANVSNPGGPTQRSNPPSTNRTRPNQL